MSFRIPFRLMLNVRPASAGAWLVPSLAGIAILASAVPARSADGQVAPAAPTQVCIVEAGACAPEKAGDDAAVKWNPGVYIRWIGARSSFSASDHFSIIDEIAEMPNIRGFNVHIFWGNLEGSTPGAYTFGELRRLYDYLEARDLRLSLLVSTKRFNGTNCEKVVPGYLVGTGTGVNTNQTGCTALLWNANVMDRLIALIEAVAIEFESESHFEVISPMEETAIGGSYPSSANYSAAAYLRQLKRLIDATASVFPTTNKVLLYNFLSMGSNAQAIELYKHMYENEFMAGGPDVFPPGPGAAGGDTKGDTWGMRIRRGDFPTVGGGLDYRWDNAGNLLHAAQVAIQPPQMGGNEGNFTPIELVQHAYETNAVTHLVVTHKTYQANPVTSEPDCANWNPPSGSFAACKIGFKAFINQGLATPPPRNRRCPANYARGCQ